MGSRACSCASPLRDSRCASDALSKSNRLRCGSGLETDQTSSHSKPLLRQMRESGVINFDSEPSLTSLFRPRFADPHHAARHRIRSMLVQDQLDNLSLFEAAGPHDLETMLRVIEDEAWNPLSLPPVLHDQTSALFQRGALQSSALGNGAAAHYYPSIFLDSNAESAHSHIEWSRTFVSVPAFR